MRRIWLELMAAAPKNKGRVFDVAHPSGSGGQIAASTTSRPVMVSNRPVIKDPMVNETASEEPSTAPVLQPTKKLVITPLHDKIKADEPVEAPEPIPEPTPNVKTEDGKPVEMLEPIKQAGVPEPKRTEKELSVDQAVAAEKSAQERQSMLAEMIEKEQYFLPINAAKQRRSRRVAVIGLVVIIVLAAAWYDVALDAGLIPNSFNIPHTSFFSIK